jgi:hypothetical protein
MLSNMKFRTLAEVKFEMTISRLLAIHLLYLFSVLNKELMKSIFFWDMMPGSAVSGYRRFGGTYRLHLQGRRIVQQSSEQATTQRTTRRYIPEEDTLQNHRCENLKSYKELMI